MPISSALALSRTCSTMRKLVENDQQVFKQSIPCNMNCSLSPRDTMTSIGRASNIFHNRTTPNCNIATDKIVHIVEYASRFFVVTESLCVFVSDDLDCKNFYWFAQGASAYGKISHVASCGKDLFACSLDGLRWLSLDSSNRRHIAWSQLVLPFPITQMSVEVPGHAFILLNTGAVGYYRYSNMGNDREQTYFMIRSVHRTATHLVAMPDDADGVVVG